MTPMRPFKNTGVALTGTAGSYTVGSGTSALRIQPSIDCWVVFGASAVTPTTGIGGNSMPITALHGAQTFACAGGQVISFIANDPAATGFIALTEMTK